MTTAHDHFAAANRLNAAAAATLSPEQRREQARSNIADIRKLTSRYVSRDGRIDRQVLRESWREVARNASAIAVDLAGTRDAGEVAQAIEQLALTVAEIAREIGGGK